jgi:transcriptional regulator with XRE-family HTH domain
MARERAANQKAAAAPDWSAQRLGRKLRDLRTDRGLRLSDLAHASGLSVSFLSQVEQGQSDIAVGRLMRIAHALEVRLTDLVELPEAPARPLVRAGERAVLPTPTEGLTIELLADSLGDDRVHAISHLAPGCIIEARGDRPPGQEYFLCLLEGRAVLAFASGEPVTLEAGDSVSFLSEDFRELSNPGGSMARLLWIGDERAARP